MSPYDMRKLMNIINENEINSHKNIINEIDRRGFLRGAGAAGLVSAGVGTASNANAFVFPRKSYNQESLSPIPLGNYEGETYYIYPSSGKYFTYYTDYPSIRQVYIGKRGQVFDMYVDCKKGALYNGRGETASIPKSGTLGEKIVDAACKLYDRDGDTYSRDPSDEVIKAFDSVDSRLSANSLITGAAGVGAAGAAVKGYQAYQNYKNKQN